MINILNKIVTISKFMNIMYYNVLYAMLIKIKLTHGNRSVLKSSDFLRCNANMYRYMLQKQMNI